VYLNINIVSIYIHVKGI